MSQQAPSPPPRRGYAICAQARSGSNLLCEYLASTDRLGYPVEYFNGPGRRRLGLPDFPDAPELQVAEILRLGTTPNGIYGVKLFVSQFAAFSGRVRWTERLPDLRFVYLDRADLLGQAISWARAVQTEQYRSTQPRKRDAVYDGGLIRVQLLTLVRERAQWEAFFARTGIAPLRLSYERLVADPAACVKAVADLVEVEPPALDRTRIELAVQRDAETERWKARFRAEHGDPNVLDEPFPDLPSRVKRALLRLWSVSARAAKPVI